ncbi:general odorant-binding protein 71-like [Nymphalis io]|uniref:general odorant-binding protein 71-like n=1 Tax=Inachis io TaxID=171585 RepID=UPI0021680894|nr:general odorant-binding protein 71-like [Nymphalis io]
MAATCGKMGLWKKNVFLYFLFISNCFALNCRSERRTKEDEFKRVFNNCLKQTERNGSRHSSEDWNNREYNQRNQWDRDSNNQNRDNRMGNRDAIEDRDRNWNNRDGETERYDRKQHRENVNHNDRMDDRYNRTNVRNNRANMNGGEGDNSKGINRMMNNRARTEQISGRDEFLRDEDFSGDVTMTHHNHYPSQSPRRYKREKRVDMNSGQRSQYNPHSQKSNSQSNHFEKRNSSNNSSKEMERACVLHCFLENLHMTDDNGMPDRYLVTHAFIKDEKNEDLQDFMQESIEECFQILDNENTDDKCEFSKNLLTCLSEKGRANCDNWNEKTGFLFE